MLTLSEAIKCGRLQEFIAQEEARGVGEGRWEEGYLAGEGGGGETQVGLAETGVFDGGGQEGSC